MGGVGSCHRGEFASRNRHVYGRASDRPPVLVNDGAGGNERRLDEAALTELVVSKGGLRTDFEASSTCPTGVGPRRAFHGLPHDHEHLEIWFVQARWVVLHDDSKAHGP